MKIKLTLLALFAAAALSATAQDTSPVQFAWQTKIAAPSASSESILPDYLPNSPRFIEPLSGGKWRVYYGGYAQVLDATGAPGPVVQSYGFALAQIANYGPIPETGQLGDGGSVSADGSDPFDRYDPNFLFEAIGPLNASGGNCIVRRFRANGELAWRTQLSGYQENCTGVFAVQDQIWAVSAGNVTRLGLDGAQIGKTRLGSTFRNMTWNQSAGDIDGGYFAGRTYLGAAELVTKPEFRSAIVRLNAAGAEQWRFTALSNERFRNPVRFSDGVLFTSDVYSESAFSDFDLIKLDRSGNERFRRRVQGNIQNIALDPNGFARAVIGLDANRVALAYFDERGLVTIRREIAANPDDTTRFEFAGNSLLMCDRASAKVFDRSGALRAELANTVSEFAETSEPCRARLSLDGEMLLAPQKRANCIGSGCFELIRVDLANATQTRWTVPDKRVKDRQLRASFEAQGGVLVASNVGSLYQIQFIDNLGAVRWQREFQESRFLTRIVANAEIYCQIEFAEPMQCNKISDNTQQFSIPTLGFFTNIKMLADRILIVEGRDESSSSTTRAVNFQGNQLFRIDEAQNVAVNLSDFGVHGFTPQSFVRWNTRGQLVSRHTLASGASSMIKLLDDGILVWNNGTLSRLGLDGATRWRVDAKVDSQTLDDFKLVGDRVVLVFENREPERSLMAGTAQIYSAQNGAQLASHPIEATDTRIVKTAIAGAPSDRITIVGTDARYAEARYVLDAQTGDLLDVQSGDLGLARALSANVDFNRFSVSTDNFLIRTMTNEFADTEMLVAKRQFTARDNLPIGDPSLIGAWYNPQLPGQGFFIQRIGNVQFLTWFFSRPDFELNPARSSRLNLQGSVPGNARVAELKIFSSNGGSFLSGAAPINEVGSASLSFQSCSDATLRYVLAAELGPEDIRNSYPPERGVIALKSLLPATGCAAPLSTPAPISTKTGLFSDPQVAGQGIMSVENQGQLFAGWFTFDPAGASNDSYSHSWFTLQGSTTPGAQTVQTQIYRTIGTIRNRSQRGSQMVVGSAEFDFQDCKNVTVNYRFIDDEAALAMRGKSGTARLTRNGDCPSQ
jgi:hypothetical protein